MNGLESLRTWLDDEYHPTGDYATYQQLRDYVDLTEIDMNKLQARVAELEKENGRLRKALQTLADGRNWWYTSDEPGGPHTAWRGPNEPDALARKALAGKEGA